MSDLRVGFGYLRRGQRWAFGHFRWYAFGLVPALIAFLLYAAALTALAFRADDIASWATPFADDWSTFWREALRIVSAVLLWAVGLALAVLTFTAVTLLIGDPFYEKLSEEVEKAEGHCPPGPDQSWWVGLWRSLCDSLYVLFRALLFTVPLFLLGFVPVAGQTVAPVLGFCVSGYFLTVELTSVAMQRRGIPVRERLRLVRARRSLALGFGVPLVLGFLLPFLAVLLTPGAVAGAALLVRDVVDGPGAAAPRSAQASDAPEGEAVAADAGVRVPDAGPRTSEPPSGS
ncbi:EI24 domain-containing protein [Streptomyces sp. TR02-1]|uniref:EI24 domain-containing protein n=1 Tax=Streptomyces sp. TR02-1 TaxID=3385977 RepID=UPI00399FDCFA